MNTPWTSIPTSINGDRWFTPLDWLRDKIAQVEDYQLLTYLNPLIGDLDADRLESDFRQEMEETGYFARLEDTDDFERTDDYTAQEWFKFYVQDLSPAQQRRTILDIAASLDSDTLQDAFQSEMDVDGYFLHLVRADSPSIVV
jgi:hypothetical protein